jgi:hypothetical protein
MPPLEWQQGLARASGSADIGVECANARPGVRRGERRGVGVMDGISVDIGPLKGEAQLLAELPNFLNWTRRPLPWMPWSRVGYFNQPGSCPWVLLLEDKDIRNNSLSIPQVN